MSVVPRRADAHGQGAGAGADALLAMSVVPRRADALSRLQFQRAATRGIVTGACRDAGDDQSATLSREATCLKGLKGTAGEIVRWSSRFKLARNFRGLQVDECSERTLRGYSGFFRVFLTHSALERYLPIVGLTEC